MYRDPIVAEVRKARAELAREADDDLEKFMEGLRNAQEKYRDRLVGDDPRLGHWNSSRSILSR
ncbi:MAG: hypothetical protein HOC74_24975 [Gemmatimonadetes bacterium]|jgi:hypothetical protein|nr:hypothetical protein [Gemmatimonadota bacterium]